MIDSPSGCDSALVNSLLRYLLCISPFRAEHVYVDSKFISPYLNKNGWTRLVTGTRMRWMYQDGKSEKGSFSTTAPAAVDPATIPTIEVPEPRPEFGLRHRVRGFADQCPDEKDRALLHEASGRMVLMGNGVFEGEALARFLQIFDHPTTSVEEFKSRLEMYRFEILAGLCSASCPGYYAGLMLLLLAAIEGVEIIVLAGVAIERDRFVTQPEVVEFALDNILQGDGPGRIAKACESLRSQALSHVKKSTTEQSDEAFYAYLFESCAYFYGAEHGFDFLAQHSLAGSDTAIAFSKQARSCEEGLIYSSSSLLHRFENLDDAWAPFHQNQRRIASLRESDGEAAAQAKALEYVTLKRFYPAHYRDALLTGAPIPPDNGRVGGVKLGKLC